MTTKEMLAISHLKRVSPVNPWSIKAHKIANSMGNVAQKRQLLFELYDEGKGYDEVMNNTIGAPVWEAVKKVFEEVYVDINV